MKLLISLAVLVIFFSLTLKASTNLKDTAVISSPDSNTFNMSNPIPKSNTTIYNGTFHGRRGTFSGQNNIGRGRGVLKNNLDGSNNVFHGEAFPVSEQSPQTPKSKVPLMILGIVVFCIMVYLMFKD